jgi:hypothetical protein
VAQVVIAHPPELRGIDHRKKIPTEVARIQVGKLAFSLLFSLPAPSPCEVRRGVFGIELGSYVCLSKLMSLKTDNVGPYAEGQIFSTPSVSLVPLPSRCPRNVFNGGLLGVGRTGLGANARRIPYQGGG